MKNKEQTKVAAESVPSESAVPSDRRSYEAPRLTKKKSVARVTLFSGGGVAAGGLTAGG